MKECQALDLLITPYLDEESSELDRAAVQQHLKECAACRRRVEAGQVDEVIIATNPTVEGEATAVYLSQQLRRPGLRVTRIAMGIPVGSDIAYADDITMLKAMEGRRDL